MKYIKTTNNIYENNSAHVNKVRFIEKTDEEYFCLEINIGRSADGWPITKTERIIKEADNIVELCDRFVLKNCDIIFLNKEHTQYRFEGSDEWYDIEPTLCIYGAIWTDRGLIYVAKMNKDRKFEYYEVHN